MGDRDYPLFDIADPMVPLLARPLADLADLPTRLVERLALCGYTTVGQIAGLMGDGEEQAVRLLDAAGVKPPDGRQAVRCVAKVTRD